MLHAIPSLPRDVWESILAMHGPVRLLSSSSRRFVSALRLQRAWRRRRRLSSFRTNDTVMLLCRQRHHSGCPGRTVRVGVVERIEEDGVMRVRLGRGHMLFVDGRRDSRFLVHHANG